MWGQGQSKTFKSFFESSVDPLCIADLEGTIRSVSRGFKELLGYQEGQIVGRSIKEFMHENDRASFQAFLSQLGLGQEQAKTENRYRCSDGNYRWISWSSPAPVDGFLFGTGRDVTEFKEVQERLEQLAFCDPLTALANRRHFEEHLHRAIARADREDSDVSVIFLDLDDFKNVNDVFGHSAADRVLVEVADRLRSATRDNDLVARFGGDEFVILIEGHSLEPETLARRIIASMKKPIPVADEMVEVGISIGIAVLPKSARLSADLVDLADRAMLSVKRNGKGRIGVHDEQLLILT